MSIYLVARYLLTFYYEDTMSVDPVVPAATGVVFHILWYFIKNIFSDLRRELRYGSVSNMESKDRFLISVLLKGIQVFKWFLFDAFTPPEYF